MSLNAKQQAFIDEYLKCWNASEAARRAGYSEKTAYSQGSRLLKKAEISEAIQEKINERAMSADEVLDRLAQQARGAPEIFFEINAGLPFLDWQKLKDNDGLRLIKKLKYDGNGRPEVEFYDAQAALVHLGRYHALFTDKLDVDAKVDANITGDDIRQGKALAQDLEQKLLDDDSDANQDESQG